MLAARKANLITARARKIKRSARMSQMLAETSRYPYLTIHGRATPILRLCQGVFTDRVIFRPFFQENVLKKYEKML